jgi:benzoyl-CoA reductase/2-hydroxyglutaryl-CoA dehydratase subunit BcrC/BadD/HgdB
MNETQYETKPIECWNKMKELRRARFRNNWEARKRGDLVIMGMHMGMKALWAGFGDYAAMSLSPYWTGIKRDKTQLLDVLEDIESRGYGRQVCGALRIHLYQYFKGTAVISPKGEKMLPDFIWQNNFCPQVSKLAYHISQELGVPYVYAESPSAGPTEGTRKYMVSQLFDAIEQAEKITGRKYDDEKLIEGTRCEIQTYKLVSEICMMNKNIPAPLHGRQLASLNLVATNGAHTKESVSFYKELLDEVKFRAQNGIAGSAVEKMRLSMESFPWPYPEFFKYPEFYGAAVVAGDHLFLNAQFEQGENGEWVPRKEADEICANLRTREDALNALAWLWLAGIDVNHHGVQNWNIEKAVEYPIRMARDWKCDGMILSANLDCWQQMHYGPETKLLADKLGIPNMLFYSILGDMRQFDQNLVRKQFDEFLTKSLGLTKIENETGEADDADME